MISRNLLRNVGFALMGLFILSSAAALAVWKSPALVGGLALGFTLGAFPFASWAWVVTRGLASSRSRAMAVILLVVKMALYAGGLYLCVTHSLVDPIGVMVGVTEVVFAICTVLALQPPVSDPKEAA